MTRQRSRRPPPPNARARRDHVSPEVAELYKAELLRRLLHNNAIVEAKAARKAGWVEQPDGTWCPPDDAPGDSTARVGTPVTAPRSCSPPADV